jgi:hypothetical protein
VTGVRRRQFLSLCATATLSGLATACTSSAGSRASTPAARLKSVSPSPGPARGWAPATSMLKAGGLTPPGVSGLGRIAPKTPPGASPSGGPAQAAPALVGHPLPTSQWWTSALVGRLSLPIWAVPLGAQVTTTGLQLSGASPTETPDHIVTPFIADITAGSAVSGLTVTGFGAFHVNLSVALAGD